MKPIRKFKKGDIVRFIGGQEENYHEEYKAIIGKQGVVAYVLDNPNILWKYEIKIDGIDYPVSEEEIEGV